MIEDVLTHIVKSLVSTPDDVDVTYREFGKLKIYSIFVNPEETGQIIGKNGKIVRAIRDFTSDLADNPSTVRINVVTPDFPDQD